MTNTKTALPILIGGAVVIGGVGLIAKRRLRPKNVSLADADLTGDEWRAAAESESADEGASG